MTRQALKHQMMGTIPAQRLRLQAVAADFVERMGRRMQDRREALGLSRADVARRMPGKTNENAVYRWEKGLHQPNPDTLQAMAEVLECDVAYFMTADPEERKTPDFFAPNEMTQLDRIEAKLDNLGDKLAADDAPKDAPAGDRRTGEELLDHLRALTSELEQMLNQQGRDISKRDLQRRAAKDHRSQGQPDVA